MKVVHRVSETHIDWSKFKYMVFDLPKHNGTYAERWNRLGNPFSLSICIHSLILFLVQQMNTTSCKYIEPARWEECKDIAHLETFFHDVIEGNGEGIILRDPAAPLQPGRSPGFLKHKVSCRGVGAL